MDIELWVAVILIVSWASLPLSVVIANAEFDGGVKSTFPIDQNSENSHKKD